MEEPSWQPTAWWTSPTSWASPTLWTSPTTEPLISSMSSRAFILSGKFLLKSKVAFFNQCIKHGLNLLMFQGRSFPLRRKNMNLGRPSFPSLRWDVHTLNVCRGKMLRLQLFVKTPWNEQYSSCSWWRPLLVLCFAFFFWESLFSSAGENAAALRKRYWIILKSARLNIILGLAEAGGERCWKCDKNLFCVLELQQISD